jgi:hypothetical protein
MKRKSLLFGLLAVLSAVLIFTGCANPADGSDGAAGPQGLGGDQGPEGPKGVATLPSGAPPALLAAYFKNADKVFVVAAPGTGNFTVPQGKTLAVVGDVNLNTVPLTINAFEGTIDVSEGKFINAGSATFLVKPDVAEAFAAAVPSGIVPEYLSSIPSPGSPTPITKDVILDSLAIGGTDNITAANFLTFAGSSDTVYVLGNAVIDATAAVNLSAPKLVVYGEIQAEGAGPLTIGANVKGSLKATGALTVAGIDNLSELDTGTYTVTSTDTALDIDALNSTGAGKLSLGGTVTAVEIGGGNGNIEFTAATGTLTALSLENTGGITFGHAAAALAVPSSVAAVFGGDVTLAGGISTPSSSTSTITFNGNVTLADGKAITIGETTVAAVTLKAGKSIFVGTGKLLTAVEEATIVADTGGAILTAAASAKTLTVATQGITVSGKVAVAETLVLNGQDITLDDGATLVLGTGAILKGTGKVIAGDTEIVGGWQAVGASGTVTITEDTITASAAAVLTGISGGSGTITVPASGTLTIAANTAINVATTGSIVLTKDGSNGGIINLSATTAKITGLKGGSTNQDFTSSNIANATYTVGTDTGNLAGGGSSGDGNAWIGGGNDEGPNNLQAGTSSNVTINKDTTIGA